MQSCMREEGQLLGVGAGQMSRVDSVKLGANKAHQLSYHLKASVLPRMRSSHFAMASTRLQNAESKQSSNQAGRCRDKEVIEAANEHGIAMLFTGMRHFQALDFSSRRLGAALVSRRRSSIGETKRRQSRRTPGMTHFFALP